MPITIYNKDFTKLDNVYIPLLKMMAELIPPMLKTAAIQFKNRWMEAKYFGADRFCWVCGLRIRVFVWGNPLGSRKSRKRDYHIIGICKTKGCAYGVQKIAEATESDLMALGPPIEKTNRGTPL